MYSDLSGLLGFAGNTARQTVWSTQTELTAGTGQRTRTRVWVSASLSLFVMRRSSSKIFLDGEVLEKHVRNRGAGREVSHSDVKWTTGQWVNSTEPLGLGSTEHLERALGSPARSIFATSCFIAAKRHFNHKRSRVCSPFCLSVSSIIDWISYRTPLCVLLCAASYTFR